MKQSNCLVSGGSDNQIIIWHLDLNHQWLTQQILSHEKYVMSWLMSTKEDLLVSGSCDGHQYFGRQQMVAGNAIKKIDMKVFALSINDSENLLISLGDNEISVLQYQYYDQKWIKIQNIEIINGGYILCFTSGNQFVFQPEAMNYLEVYNFDNINFKFQKLSQVEIQSCDKCNMLFPCQFIKPLNILTVSHGGFLNIFKINSDGNNRLIQTINMKKKQIYMDVYQMMANIQSLGLGFQ